MQNTVWRKTDTSYNLEHIIPVEGSCCGENWSEVIESWKSVVEDKLLDSSKTHMTNLNIQQSCNRQF